MNRLFVLTSIIVSLAACGGGDAENNHSHDANHSHENNHHHATNNGTSGEVDEYSDGLMKHGHEENFMVMLVSADPAPPDVGDNSWTLRLVDMEENPIDDAKVTVSPFMPGHGHGTTPADYTATFTDDGTYEVGPFDLFMPGVWETTVTVDSGGTEDMVVFSFELEG